jgi:hypothetical protein
MFDYFALRLGYGIEGVAFSGTPLTYFIYSCIVIGYALFHYTRDVRDWCRYFAGLWLPFVYMLGLLWLTELAVRRWIPASTRIGLTVAASVQTVLYLIGITPLIGRAAREMKLDFSLLTLSRVRSAH